MFASIEKTLDELNITHAEMIEMLGYSPRFVSVHEIHNIRRQLTIIMLLKRKTKEMCATPELAREWIMKLGIHNEDGTLKDD